MVDHIALVFGVVEAQRTAQVFGDVIRYVVVVTGLHMHVEGVSETDLQAHRRIIKPLTDLLIVNVPLDLCTS